MDRKEIELEAEKYGIENYESCIYDDVKGWETDRKAREQSFKDGAEFVYKENEWHYLKDGNLPNTDLGRVDVTVAYINAYENPCKKDCCFDGTNFIYWDDRKPIGWKKVDIFGKIYAWKYPEKLPEIPKEN